MLPFAQSIADIEVLAEADRQAFFAALEDPSSPGHDLKEAMRLHSIMAGDAPAHRPPHAQQSESISTNGEVRKMRTWLRSPPSGSANRPLGSGNTSIARADSGVSSGKP